MKHRLNKITASLALATVLLSGCSSTDEQAGSFTDGTGGMGGNIGVDTNGTGGSSFGGSEFGNGGSGGSGGGFGSAGGQGGGGPNGTKTIYFMFDSSQVQEEFVPVVEAHARYLQSNQSQRIIVAGHGDERGSREYNIALGEQRAKSVARMLTMQGAKDTQIEVVSYGEEKPAAMGHDESAWQLNRRAELDYQGQ